MRNIVQKLSALQRVIGFAEEHLATYKKEFGRESAQYKSLNEDLSIAHELRRDLYELKEKNDA